MVTVSECLELKKYSPSTSSSSVQQAILPKSLKTDRVAFPPDSLRLECQTHIYNGLRRQPFVGCLYREEAMVLIVSKLSSRRVVMSSMDARMYMSFVSL